MAFGRSPTFPQKQLLTPIQDFHNKIATISALSRDLYSATDPAVQARIGARLVEPLAQGRIITDILKKGLEGGFLSHGAITKLLESPHPNAAAEVAYLHRYINQFEEVLQSIAPALNEVIKALRTLHPGDLQKESPLSTNLQHIRQAYADYDNAFRDLIRKEGSSMLSIPGVDSDHNNFDPIIRLYAATVAFSEAVARVSKLS